MKKAFFLVISVVLAASFLFPQMSLAQSHFAVGAKASTFGIGFEGAVPVGGRINIRGGGNFFNYNRTFDKDGVTYRGEVKFRSAEAHLDWLPMAGGFHISPGVLIYNGNEADANAFVPGGQTFTLNDTDYVSDPANPMRGTGKIDFLKAAPMVTAGFGNLIPRGGRHWSIPFEFGVVFQGAPRAHLSFTGGACDAGGVNCRPIDTDPTVQSNVLAEQNKINHDISAFKVYPVISIGFAVNF